jgi:hypothetical protein
MYLLVKETDRYKRKQNITNLTVVIKSGLIPQKEKKKKYDMRFMSSGMLCCVTR